MSDDDMLACFGNATACVFAADYEDVSRASVFKGGKAHLL